MKLSVVMPAYNEDRTIEEIVQKVLAVEMEKELIIVDRWRQGHMGAHQIPFRRLIHLPAERFV